MTNFKEFLKEIGSKWQRIWDEKHVFEADPDPTKPKYFLTFPYPYVNGSVHMGHGYSAMKLDFMARYKRMKGFNVLFPQGFHATGEPIVGMAKRLAKGDKIQRTVLQKFGVKEEDFEKFYDPTYIVSFFMKLMKKDMRSIGLSIDWRRQFITTPITPVYSKFVEWQYLTLKKMGYVILGSHPVIWCPKDQSPTGDHDRLVGEGVTIVEYVLLKFPFEDAYFLPATLRAETIYGVTNMYLNPNETYVKAEVDGEKWIVSEQTIIKLKDQEHEVKVLSKHSANEFFGKYCKNPVTGNEVIILPATFVDANWGTGVVMSVPAHAPVDWVAIKNVKDRADELEKEYGIAKEEIMKIEPISLIEVEGYGEFPAVEIIEKMGITDQNDPEVEKATKEIYKAEFHTGICKEITGKYKGKLVHEVKDDIISDFIKQNIATKMYEPADEVICRCGTRNHVKILSEQWFLKYSDPEWKKAAHQQIDKMKFYPENVIPSFRYTVDWLEDKACARKSGLGTPLPWDPEWIVETLSDSTVYMSYYTISKYVNAGKLTEKNAIPEFFDFIFRDIGEINDVSKKCGLPVDLISKIKDEFNYWYPLDLRGSGKDLIHNHLTFCIFQHVALFKPEHRPLAFSVNGYMNFQGEKMSKSKGILTPLSEAVERYSVDVTRLGLLGAGEGLDDANFDEKDVLSLQRWLEQFKTFYGEKQTRSEENHIDRWIKTRIQYHIKEATEFAERLQTRSYVQKVFYGIINDLRYYKKRSKDIGPGFTYASRIGLLMLNPIVPHFCEELWSKDHDKLLVYEPFPQIKDDFIDEKAVTIENYLNDLIEDINNIKKAMKSEEIKELEIIVSPAWKEYVLDEYLSNPDKLIPRIMKNEEVKKQGKQAAQYAQKLLKSRDGFKKVFSREEEYQIIKDNIEYIESVLNSSITVNYAEDSTSPRKKFAEPQRPAIYIR